MPFEVPTPQGPTVTRLWRRAKAAFDRKGGKTYENAVEIQRAERALQQWRKDNMTIVNFERDCT